MVGGTNWVKKDRLQCGFRTFSPRAFHLLPFSTVKYSQSKMFIYIENENNENERFIYNLFTLNIINGGQIWRKIYGYNIFYPILKNMEKCCIKKKKI